VRKVQKFIVRGKEVFVGLEDSKRTWKICARSGGSIVDEVSMPADYDNLRAYLKDHYPECEIQVMYEAGFGGFWLHDLLEGDGIDCIVTPANKVTQEKVNKVKTDRVDARRLARNLEYDDYTSCHVPDRELREDRQVSRKSLKTLQLTDQLQSCMNAYLQALDSLTLIRSELLEKLEALCKKDRYKESVKVKESCPGVGRLSAIRLTLEWGDISRFESGKHLASYAGLTSSEYSTGETIHRGRITRQGSGQVRAWLIQCAWRAICRDPILREKFHAVWGNSGSKKKAIVAVARKLAVRMRAIELAKEPYLLGVIE
jgi:transposase